MPEAFGKVIISAPEGLLRDMLNCDEGAVHLLPLVNLFSFAGIPSLTEAHPMLRWVSEEFPEEGKEVKNGFICIDIFGDEWMYLIEALVTQGKGIQAYGVIDHEHGSRGYYALNQDGVSYFEVVDYEGDVNTENETSIKERWKNLASPEALVTFPEAFVI